MISDENKVIWIGIGLTGLWWILESLIHVVIFHESTFIRQLVNLNPHEFWMRTLTGALIIIFTIYAQTIINRLRRAERESKRAAHAELEQIFQTAADGMRVVDRDYNMLRVNETLLNMAGISREKALGIKCYETFPGLLCHTDGCPLTRILGGEERVEAEVEKERMDGSRVTCVLTATPFQNPEGELLGIVEDFKDITHLKQAEARIEHLNTVLLAVRDLDQLIMHEKDPARLIVQACEVLARTHGYHNAWIAIFDNSGHVSATAESGLGKEVFRQMRDRLDAGDLPRCVRSALAKEGVVVTEDPAADCPDCPLSATCSPGQGTITARLESGGRVYGVISLAVPLSIIHDTEEQALFMEATADLAFALHASDMETERKAAERALEITNKKLQLLSGITRHDILNQVTGLGGYTDLLSEVLPDDPDMREYIDRITKATSDIERQITFTRDYEHLGVDPSGWQRVADTAERAASGCADRNVNVSISTGTLEVFADPMLEKVFYNLFDNAIRHGEHVTEISVTCQEEDGDGSLVIAVEDDGVGIPPEIKEKIFSHGFGKHTGYGLFLVQEILAITGMSIRETGEEGRGARFEIIVPSGGWRLVP